VLGGVLGVLAGLVIAAVLNGDPGAMWAQEGIFRAVQRAVRAAGLAGREFPYDYGILIITGGVVATAGVVAYLFVHEPPAEHVHRRLSVRRQLEDGFAMLKRMPSYRTFLWMRAFYQLTAMSFPFYATFAYLRLGFSEASVGVFVSLWVAAGVVSNLVWGRLLDRRGNRIVFVSTAALSVFPPIAVLVLAARDPRPAGEVGLGLFALVASTFLLNGFVRSGRFIANHTYLLESAPATRRPLYVGFMNSLTFPFMLSPILGGVVVAAFGYTTLFVVAALSALADLAASTRLIEPRSRTHAPVDEPAAV
jgi:predicted MFS family arabinose efflux permease